MLRLQARYASTLAQEVRLQQPEQPPHVLQKHEDLANEMHQDYGHRHGDVQLTEEQKHRLHLRQQVYLKQATFHNSPSDPSGYEMFRRIALYLSAIQDQKQLYAEPLILERSWTIPASAVSAEGFQSLEKEFTVHYNQQEDIYTLHKQLVGPILITNYDHEILCCEQREDLYHLINPWIENDVVFDIRPEYVGGEWPIRGVFRLSSFHTILNFLSHLLGKEPEYDVAKDPRTPSYYPR